MERAVIEIEMKEKEVDTPPAKKKSHLWVAGPQRRFDYKILLKKSRGVILGFTLIAITIALGMFIGRYFESTPVEVCQTKQCVNTAQKFMQYMNANVDPCEQFYEFACENFKSSNVIATDDRVDLGLKMFKQLEGYIKEINEFSIEPLQQMKLLYQSCMDFQTELEEELVKIYQGLSERIFKPENSLAQTLAAIRRETGMSPIFNINVLPSYDDDTSMDILIYKHMPVTPKEKLVSNLLKRNQTTFNKLLESAWLNNLTSTNGERMTLKELQFFFIDSNFSWIEFMKALFEGLGEPEITEHSFVMVEDIPYLETVGRIFASTPIDEIEMYLRDQVNHTLYVPAVLSLKAKNPEIRTYMCVSLVGEHMPLAMGHIFVSKIDSHVLNETIEETRELMRYVSIAFKNIVSQADWMDSKTKAGLLKKVDNLKVNIGYKEWLRNSSEMTLFHKGLNVSNQPFPESLLTVMRWNVEKELKEYYVPSEVASDWLTSPMSPSTVNAYYVPQVNEIAIPVAFMQPPNTGLGLRFADFGAMGFVIGHELGHGFTARFRHRNDIGKLNSRWSPAADSHYKTKEKCFETQYESYWRIVLSQFDLEIDSMMQTTIALGEHLADDVGIRVAFEAYKLYILARGKPEPTLPGFEKYTSEQMFFLSMAHSWCSSNSDISPIFVDDHGPNFLRVIGTLENHEEFSKVWGCSKTSKMNRVDKCVLY